MKIRKILAKFWANQETSQAELQVHFDGMPVHQSVISTTKYGKGINPVFNIRSDFEFCMEMLQKSTQYRLDEKQKAIARSSMSSIPQEQEITILDLHELWATHQELQCFASAIKLYLIP